MRQFISVASSNPIYDNFLAEPREINTSTMDDKKKGWKQESKRWMSVSLFPTLGFCLKDVGESGKQGRSRGPLTKLLWELGRRLPQKSWGSPGKNTGEGGHFLPPGDLPKPRDRTHIFHVSCICRQVLYWTKGGSLFSIFSCYKFTCGKICLLVSLHSFPSHQYVSLSFFYVKILFLIDNTFCYCIFMDNAIYLKLFYIIFN